MYRQLPRRTIVKKEKEEKRVEWKIYRRIFDLDI